ncbi:MAG: hypothetical protein VW270_00255 [Candidatus Poseidoniales archaeon]
MAGGVLNLAGITVFKANNGVIEIPNGTQIKGVTDVSDTFLSTATFDVSTNMLQLTTTDGNAITVDLSSLSNKLIGTASQDATALAIALG